jgi:hypothetical protein
MKKGKQKNREGERGIYKNIKNSRKKKIIKNRENKKHERK